MIAIFTYGFSKATDAFRDEGCRLDTLSNYGVLVDMAADSGYISAGDVETLKEWRRDPVWGTECNKSPSGILARGRLQRGNKKVKG